MAGQGSQGPAVRAALPQFVPQSLNGSLVSSFLRGHSRGCEIAKALSTLAQAENSVPCTSGFLEGSLPHRGKSTSPGPPNMYQHPLVAQLLLLAPIAPLSQPPEGSCENVSQILSLCSLKLSHGSPLAQGESSKSSQLPPRPASSDMLPRWPPLLCSPWSLQPSHTGLLTVRGTHEAQPSLRAFARVILSAWKALLPDLYMAPSLTTFRPFSNVPGKPAVPSPLKITPHALYFVFFPCLNTMISTVASAGDLASLPWM